SQVGIGIGLMRGGIIGAILAFIGFTLPSVLALTLFALFMQGMDLADAGWIHGLKLVAVSIVAHAVYGMGQKLATGRSRLTIAVAAASVALLWPTPATQVLLIVCAGVIGVILYRETSEAASSHVTIRLSRTAGV